MSVSLHTMVIGQPFRLRPVRRALQHCVEHKLKDRVWYTRAVDIADYCFTLPPGTIVGSCQIGCTDRQADREGRTWLPFRLPCAKAPALRSMRPTTSVTSAGWSLPAADRS